MEWKKQLINYGENVGRCVKIYTEGRKKTLNDEAEG